MREVSIDALVRKATLLGIIIDFQYKTFLTSIIHAKRPQGYDNAMPCFNVIFDDETVWNAFDLLFAFLASTDFERVAIYAEIRNFRGSDNLIYTHLVVEKGLSQTADVDL